MFKLEIETRNAAFEDDPSYEVARLLEVVSQKVGEGQVSGSILDINGNQVGTYWYEESE